MPAVPTNEFLCAVVFVDCDNLADVEGWRKLPDPGPQISYALKRLANEAIRVGPTADFVDIRLYGGWLEGDIETQWASKLRVALSQAKIFPTYLEPKKRFVHGNVDLTTRLRAMPSLQLTHTARKRTGLPKLRFAAELKEVCSYDRTACPVRALCHFSESRGKQCPIEGCEVDNSAAFSVLEQKMVDTMLACDLLTFSTEASTVVNILVSSDTDLVPPTLLAAQNGKPTFVLSPAGPFAEPFSSILQERKISVRDWKSV